MRSGSSVDVVVMKCVSFVAWSVLESFKDFAKSHRVAANNVGLLLFLAQLAEEGSKPVLLRCWLLIQCFPVSSHGHLVIFQVTL